MGFVRKQQPKAEVKRLPSGAFTVDAQGQVISSTVPHSVPAALVREIGLQVIGVFQGARRAQVAFSELVVQYAAFKITARELRGGAIIFLQPKLLQLVIHP